MNAAPAEREQMAGAGYARIIIGNMIHAQLNKRFLRRPYLKYGQCPALWGYLFELGGILVGKHATQLGAFATVFLGTFRGGDRNSADVKHDCTDIATNLVSRKRVNGSMTFFEYAQTEFIDKFPGDYKGDTLRFFREHGMDKIRPEIADRVAIHFAPQGVALGAIYPELIKAMFQRTYSSHTREEWERAHAAGLDIGPYQPAKTYEEAEEVENKDFMQYCRECRPDLYSILNT